MKRCGIYVLSDPITREIRYVGQSKDIIGRFYYHKWAASKTNRDESYSKRWIAKLLREKRQPVLQTLQEFSDVKHLDDAEIYWIAYFRSIGCPLTNSSAGGKGTRDPSPETRWKMGSGMRGRKHTPESLELCRANGRNSKGRKQSPEAAARVAASKWKQIVCLNDGRVFNHAGEAATQYGLAKNSIHRVARGIQKRLHGYTFAYVVSSSSET